MDANLYVGLSGQLALERRLSSIANNVANAGTVGFRAEGTHFESLVSRTVPFQTMFSSAGAQHTNTQSGGLVKTGNPLDVAVQGAGFMAIDTPGGVAYTRDGRMQILPTGDLVSLNGHAILDASGSSLTLDPLAGPVEIGRDGMISQHGRAVGAIGLFNLDLNLPHRRYENSAFMPDAPPEAVVDFARDGVLQGYTEQSNVNPVLEMAHLIRVSRMFEAVASGLEQRDQTLRDAIQALGSRS
jgi:flagellar basal-body rod protein FlgF